MQIVVAFNKKGDKTASLMVPEMPYLQTKKQWINNAIERSPQMDGIVMLIDWETREISVIRHALD